MANTRHFSEPTVKNPYIKPNINMDSTSLNFQGMAVQQPRETQRNVRCFNCGTQGHMFNQCTEPWCSRCQQSWRSTTDTRYHNMSKCPSRPDNRLPSAPVLTQKPIPAAAPAMQNNKRPFNEITYEAANPKMQPFTPRPAKQPFPPRGTAPKPMRSNTATSQTAMNEVVDYNDIYSLRAFVVRAHQNADESTNKQYEENPEDADWNPDVES